ncbi:MAG: hypothetical protein A2W26_10425 [Acidobacteria bacterium RBG_16_64_8]|nr:MAG: hypothetical protein A2W26_10425 [Acidobacteria bacterium RBG_16_64_8]
MTDIRVDPDKLRSGAVEIEAVAEAVDTAACEAGKTALGVRIDSSYAAQLAGKLGGYGTELLTQAGSIINGLREHSTWLRGLAQRFEEADQAAVEGLDTLWATSRALLVRYGESPYVMRWLLDGSRPPWIPSREWWQLSEEDRELIIQGLRRDHAKFMAGRTVASFRPAELGSSQLEESFEIFRNGLPEELFDPETGERIAPYVVGAPLFSIPALPDGREYIDPISRRRGFTRYQYQDLRHYLDRLSEGQPHEREIAETVRAIQTRAWSSSHHNLCGLDAVGYATGVRDMMETYVAFATVNEQMLINGDTAWTFEIRDLYREMGWEAQQIGRFAGDEHNVWLHWNEADRSAYPTFDDVTGKLAQGYAITPLVGVDSGAGKLSADPDATVGHFVTISDTMVTQDGTQLIRVYNSLEHREEIYTWETFDEVWRNAGGNSGGQAAIARPPD